MKTLPLAALPLLLASCQTMVAPAPVAPPLESAWFEVRSWGNLVHRWTLDARGQVDHVRDETPFGGREKPGYQHRRTTLTTAQVAALSRALDRVATEAARPEGCEARFTDGPYGKIAWTKAGQATAFSWNTNCSAGRDADLSAALKAADAIVDEAAMATPVLDMLPEEGGGKGS